MSNTTTLVDKWLRAPLYEAEEGTSDLLDAVKTFRTLQGQHETYCPQCKKDAIFKFAEDRPAIEQSERDKAARRLGRAIAPTGATSGTAAPVGASFPWLDEFKIHMRCTRRPEHFISVYFHAWLTSPSQGPLEERIAESRWHLQKIGQVPSLVDFRLHEIEAYQSGFSKSQVREWKRSLFTEAYGFNVAACVHLRRLFESLLFEARDTVEGGRYKGEKWHEWDSSTTPDRVKLVASEMPQFIVDHPELYKVLSKGVHELTEEECGREMPVLQRCMKLIAQQRVEQKMRRRSEAETNALLAEAAARLAGPLPGAHRL